ncbi:hypothetical protein ABZ705_32135 [Streptomyces sp. NPDC006984]|uniref:hypothetical protein n=1 Tax=unclassified Streptomyces TaxID=2593676 RepID=UPI00211CA67E|nr:hypothetical protein [Streptomyces sp. WZ.A104]
MPEHNQQPDWSTMTEAEFDHTAPNTLPVTGGPARIVAQPGACGTEALFGEEPPPAPVKRPAPKPGGPDGQEELF